MIATELLKHFLDFVDFTQHKEPLTILEVVVKVSTKDKRTSDIREWTINPVGVLLVALTYWGLKNSGDCTSTIREKLLGGQSRACHRGVIKLGQQI